MAAKSVNTVKSKLKLSPAVKEEIRFLDALIANSERAAAGVTGELKVYFEKLAKKNRDTRNKLTR